MNKHIMESQVATGAVKQGTRTGEGYRTLGGWVVKWGGYSGKTPREETLRQREGEGTFEKREETLKKREGTQSRGKGRAEGDT